MALTSRTDSPSPAGAAPTPTGTQRAIQTWVGPHVGWWQGRIEPRPWHYLTMFALLVIVSAAFVALLVTGGQIR